MSSTAPLRLGYQHDNHAILAVFHTIGEGRHSQFEDVVVGIDSWHVAIGMFQALEDGRMAGEFGHHLGAQLKHFCVRSVEDPRVHKAVGLGSYNRLGLGQRDALRLVERKAAIARKATKRKALGEIALAAVKDESLTTLGEVSHRIREDCNRKGLNVQGYEIWDAIRARVLTGRAILGYGNSLRTTRKGGAFFLVKKDGPLHAVEVNGYRLGTTSLSYSGVFSRVIKDEDGSYRVAGS